MKKVQAQRKFAQGAIVPNTPVQPERRTVEATPENVVITSDISAVKLLDTVAFANSGMHLHYARVVLKRLPSPAVDKPTTSASSVAHDNTAAQKRHHTVTHTPSPVTRSTRILRSMRQSTESDDRPLTYHKNNDKIPKSASRNSRSVSRNVGISEPAAHILEAKRTSSEKGRKRRVNVKTNGPGTSRNSRSLSRNIGISEPAAHILKAKRTSSEKGQKRRVNVETNGPGTSRNSRSLSRNVGISAALIPEAKRTAFEKGRKRRANVKTNGPGTSRNSRSLSKNVGISEPAAHIPDAKRMASEKGQKRRVNVETNGPGTSRNSRSLSKNVGISEPAAHISEAKRTASEKEPVAQIPAAKQTAPVNGRKRKLKDENKGSGAKTSKIKLANDNDIGEHGAHGQVAKQTASANEHGAHGQVAKQTASANEHGAHGQVAKQTASANEHGAHGQVAKQTASANEHGAHGQVAKQTASANEHGAHGQVAKQTASANVAVASCLAAERISSENEPVASCLAAEETASENQSVTHGVYVKQDLTEASENVADDDPDDDYRDYQRMEDEEYDDEYAREESDSPRNLVLNEELDAKLEYDDEYAREESDSPRNLVLNEELDAKLEYDDEYAREESDSPRNLVLNEELDVKHWDHYAFDKFNDNSISPGRIKSKQNTDSNIDIPIASRVFPLPEHTCTLSMPSSESNPGMETWDIPSTSADPQASSAQSSQLCFNEAPVYYPTAAEFTDPLEYYIKIAPEASKYGLCKVVAPAGFIPNCNINNLDKLDAHHQYVARLFKRWGEATRFLSAVYACLTSHGIKMPNLPLVNGLEINLPKLFRVVQKYGGFNEVTRKQRWPRVAEELNLSDVKTPDKVLDNIYLKFLLPYDILNENERMVINGKAEDVWLELHEKMLKRARNPLHCKKVYTGESEASGSEEDEPSEEVKYMRKKALELEECVGPGRKITLKRLEQVDSNAKKMFFSNPNPTADDIENGYWEIVLQGSDHVCVYSVSVDTSSTEVGFPTNPNDSMSEHPWNLKNIVSNERNILRSLGAVVSMTAPILHIGMTFTTNCWYRDPHGLPWVEYLHSGPGKIWYGIAKEDAAKFRAAVEALCPTVAQNKKIWLPSDICMIPPKLLMQQNVKITRTVQKSGEFIFIFPEAYSSSMCTGLTVSESVYFAVEPWLTTIHKVFQELRESGEPMTFSPEQLLIALSRDERVPLALLQQVFPSLHSTVEEELTYRYALIDRGLVEVFVGQNPNKPWNVSEAVECDVCRRPLFLSKVTGKFHHSHLNQTCPQDAKQITEKFKNQNDLVLEILVSEAELRAIVTMVQNKLLIVNSSLE